MLAAVKDMIKLKGAKALFKSVAGEHIVKVLNTLSDEQQGMVAHALSNLAASFGDPERLKQIEEGGVTFALNEVDGLLDYLEATGLLETAIKYLEAPKPVEGEGGREAVLAAKCPYCNSIHQIKVGY